MHIVGHRRLTIASLACALLALISHSAAMSLAATAAFAIARQQKLGDQVERLSFIGAFDLVALDGGVDCARARRGFSASSNATNALHGFRGGGCW